MASHAALGVVRAGVAVLKGTGVRINCISPGQIEVGVDLKDVCVADPLFALSKYLFEIHYSSICEAWPLNSLQRVFSLKK
jgi:hypothetical protein